MRRLFLALLLAWPAAAADVPFKCEDPFADENFRELANRLARHQHNNDGTVRLDHILPPPKSDIDDAITSQRAGEIYFNSIDFEWCGSTQTASSTAWVKIHAPTTACGR